MTRYIYQGEPLLKKRSKLKRNCLMIWMTALSVESFMPFKLEPLTFVSSLHVPSHFQTGQRRDVEARNTIHIEDSL